VNFRAAKQGRNMAIQTNSGFTAGNFREAHAPQTLTDLVWSTQTAKDLVQDYVDGLIDGHLLLHGPFGTGKTSICKMVPFAITGDPNIIHDTLFVNASNVTTKAKLIPLIQNFALLMPLVGSTRFIHLDEADRMDGAAQDALKGLIDDVGDVVRFLITTNHLRKIDGGIQSRCHAQEIDHCQPSDFRPFAKRILLAEKIPLGKVNLTQALDDGAGEGRKTMQQLERLVARYRRNNP
jgi:DNA polymerase III delta prime subunit